MESLGAQLHGVVPAGIRVGFHRGRSMSEPSNKGMKLTKLSAAPTLAPQAALGRRCRLVSREVVEKDDRAEG